MSLCPMPMCPQQELNSVNYLDLYRVADLFHLPALEEAVVSFLVEHLSELQQSRLEEVLLLPYRLLRDVLMSDRLTSLNEEEIWQVHCTGSSQSHTRAHNGRNTHVRKCMHIYRHMHTHTHTIYAHHKPTQTLIYYITQCVIKRQLGSIHSLHQNTLFIFMYRSE